MKSNTLQYQSLDYTPPSEADIRAELNRVVTSPLFSETTRMKRFLRFVVEEALEGRADRLKGYTIGLEVFDRSDNFDPQADTIVRVQAGQMRRRLDLYYNNGGRNDPIRIVIPKGGYAPKFLVQDLEPARLESPEKADKQMGSQPEGLHRNARHLGPSVAVLSFGNLSDETDDYFAEGMTSEVINALVRFRFLRVISRTATSNPTLAELDIGDLGEK